MPTRIFLSGCNGRMGQVITDIANQSDDLDIVAGSDLNTQKKQAYPVFSDPAACDIDFDVLVDFSNPAALPAVFDLIRSRKSPAVICTTGMSDIQEKEMAELSKTAAIFKSANMSLGINMLISLARQAAKLMYPDFDIEVLDAHHNQKVDAPSGTALMIANQLNEELDNQLDLVFDRSRVRKKRENNEIGVHAIRGGSIVGEHTVYFAGQDEVMTIHHSAGSRSVFARGALAAARFMAGKKPGFYNMNDLIQG